MLELLYEALHNRFGKIIKCGGVKMFYLLFGGLLVFTGFYLIFKIVYQQVKGEHISARLAGFNPEGDSLFPVFNFTYNGQEYNITSGVSVKSPENYKYQVGDMVNIIFVPTNTKYVDVEGSKVEWLYALGSIAGGVVFILLYCRQHGII